MKKFIKIIGSIFSIYVCLGSIVCWRYHDYIFGKESPPLVIPDRKDLVLVTIEGLGNRGLETKIQISNKDKIAKIVQLITVSNNNWRVHYFGTVPHYPYRITLASTDNNSVFIYSDLDEIMAVTDGEGYAKLTTVPSERMRELRQIIKQE